jgi:hypothetical protein
MRHNAGIGSWKVSLVVCVSVLLLVVDGGWKMEGELYVHGAFKKYEKYRK